MTTPWARAFGYRTQKDRSGDEISALLAKIPIFEDLNKRDLAAVERILHRRDYDAGEPIFRQDDPALGMYIIQSGEVTILLEPSGIVVSELHNGDFFGEVGLLDESPRSATARAKTHCSVFGFFQPDLFGLIERDPRLGVKIVLRVARIIGARLRKTNEQAMALAEEVQKLKGRPRAGSRQE